MSVAGVRGVIRRRKRAVWVAGVVLAVGLFAVVWRLAAGRWWPFAPAPDPFVSRLEDSTSSLEDYADRLEGAMRLQFLEAALVDGRRSAELRPEYRRMEDHVEEIIARSPTEERDRIRTELVDLLPELARDRGAARDRIERLIDELLDSAGPGRQGDD